MATINPMGQSDLYMVPRNWYAVTPHDTNALSDGTNTIIAKVLYVGGAGNVTATTSGGQTVTFTGVPAGQYVYGLFTHVLSTSTTATTILMGW